MDAKKYLEQALKRGRVHHSIVLEGGGEEAVRFFAQRLLCQGSHCSEAYLDEVYRVSPEGRTIKLQQVRELLQVVRLKPFAAPWRLVVIEEAEAMTPEAANALLKTLEEPPPSTYFLLLTSSPSSLLPTVLSRCLILSWEEGRKARKRRLKPLGEIKNREGLREFLQNLYLFLRDWIAWKQGSEPLFFAEDELSRFNLREEGLGDFLPKFDKIYSISDRANLSITKAYLSKILKEIGIGQL